MNIQQWLTTAIIVLVIIAVAARVEFLRDLVFPQFKNA